MTTRVLKIRNVGVLTSQRVGDATQGPKVALIRSVFRSDLIIEEGLRTVVAEGETHEFKDPDGTVTAEVKEVREGTSPKVTLSISIDGKDKGEFTIENKGGSKGSLSFSQDGGVDKLGFEVTSDRYEATRNLPVIGVVVTISGIENAKVWVPVELNVPYIIECGQANAVVIVNSVYDKFMGVSIITSESRNPTSTSIDNKGKVVASNDSVEINVRYGGFDGRPNMAPDIKTGEPDNFQIELQRP